MLARELKTGAVPFVVLEQNEQKAADVRARGYLCLSGDATDEQSLLEAGITRARILATVLPNDAANVFITLSARALNPGIEIIARGEAVATESKLIQAGANRVVLPAHIGAERIAELILFPETARMLRESTRFNELERTLRGLGLEMEVVVVPQKGALTGLSIAAMETRAAGKFFVLQLNRQAGDSITNPDRGLKVQGGDGVSDRQPQRRRVGARHVRCAGGKAARRTHHLLTFPPPFTGEGGPQSGGGGAPSASLISFAQHLPRKRGRKTRSL